VNRVLLIVALLFAPSLHAGTDVTLTLPYTAAYRTPDRDECAATATAAAVRARHPHLQMSAGLADIASALAAALDRPSSSPLEATLRHRAGVPNPNLLVVSLSTTEDGDTDLLDTIDRVVAEHPGLTHIGWGRSAERRIDGRWQLFVVGQTRRASLESGVPTATSGDVAVPLHFRLAPHQHDPSVLVQFDAAPSTRMTPVDRGDGTWLTVVPVRRGTTRVSLQVAATGPEGPAPLLTMSMDVDPPAHSRAPHFTVHLQASARAPDTAADAAARILQLLNESRNAHGLEPLIADPTLAAVALEHSQDMVVNGFIAHRSPVTGGLRDRLEDAGLHALVALENLARDPSIDDAHRQLMASPGHRANALHPDVTHAGVGVVRELREDGPPHWVVTVVMTHPLTPITGPEAEAALLDILDRRRANAGLPLFTRSTVLDAAAAELGRHLADDGSWRDEAFAEAQQWLTSQGVVWKRLRANLVVGREAADLENSTGGSWPQFGSVGISARTHHDRAGNPYVVVCLVFMES
jgi:uncharacterized protein YkwD